MPNEYCLGTAEAAKQLLRDLYADLRIKTNRWAAITKQTNQARMGYIGQHLVSVVTGCPGGKSGARGHDLVMPDEKYGEIKTCYRVDQLGICPACDARVSSFELECPNCGSREITRKDDSKWLITIRNDAEFSRILDPDRYYFVLFEYISLSDSDNRDTQATIWEVDPKNPGFSYCMIDYYLNIRTKSESHAAFDLWPYSFKFMLMKPVMIYRSVIHSDGGIDTLVFSTDGSVSADPLKPLPEYENARTCSSPVILSLYDIFKERGFTLPDQSIFQKRKKKEKLTVLEHARETNQVTNDDLCDLLAGIVYIPRIRDYIEELPAALKAQLPRL